MYLIVANDSSWWWMLDWTSPMTTMLVMSPEPGLRILERSLVMLERWVNLARLLC